MSQYAKHLSKTRSIQPQETQIGALQDFAERTELFGWGAIGLVGDIIKGGSGVIAAVGIGSAIIGGLLLAAGTPAVVIAIKGLPLLDSLLLTAASLTGVFGGAALADYADRRYDELSALRSSRQHKSRSGSFDQRPHSCR